MGRLLFHSKFLSRLLSLAGHKFLMDVRMIIGQPRNISYLQGRSLPALKWCLNRNFNIRQYPAPSRKNPLKDARLFSSRF